MKRISIAVVLTFMVWTNAAAISISHLTEQQYNFIKLLLPSIRTEDNRILTQRRELLRIHEKWQRSQKLTLAESKWLERLAAYYHLEREPLNSQAFFKRLIRRVNMVPVSLVLAQAIIESNWGRSRFAAQGHNYFGLWCYSKGCGLVPKRRPARATYEVKKFKRPGLSVIAYIRNLNTNKAYQAFRRTRERMIEKHQPLNPLVLSSTLLAYSSEGSSYTKAVRAIIKKYQLASYDVYFKPLQAFL